MSVIQFFLSELHAKNGRFQLCAFLEFRKISEITSAVKIFFLQKETLADSLCRIPAHSSFVDNFQEGLQVHLKRTPLQKFLKNIGGAYKNSNIFYKIFYGDTETSEWTFRSLTLTKSCYSKRYIKIQGPHPSQPPYLFYIK